MTKIVSGATMSLDAPASAAHWREVLASTGAIVCGRHLFDITSGQALQAGLLDEIGVDIVPVLLGGGTPYFEALGAPVDLEGPISTIQGEAVTHLRYRVVRQ